MSALATKQLSTKLQSTTVIDGQFFSTSTINYEKNINEIGLRARTEGSGMATAPNNKHGNYGKIFHAVSLLGTGVSVFGGFMISSVSVVDPEVLSYLNSNAWEAVKMVLISPASGGPELLLGIGLVVGAKIAGHFVGKNK